MAESKMLSFNSEDAKKTGMALVWSALATALAALAFALTDPESRDALLALFPRLGPVIPIVNALIYGAYRYVNDNRK